VCRFTREKLVVITGLSGSGSLAFDTIYAEGQRRVETFSAYARQFWVV
jgi:excinuclease UvrABC ATPase subunit